MKILALSVHPDDETFGCGGTLLKHAAKGDEVHWLILTAATESIGYDRAFVEKRAVQIDAVSKAYGFKTVHQLGFPAARLHSSDFGEIVRKIQDVLNSVRPDTVYTVNRSDVHSDHQVAAKAFFSAAKVFKTPFIKSVLMYECLSETEAAPPLPENMFLPNVYSDVEKFWDKKVEITKIYESEVQPSPLPRSIDAMTAQARFRGAAACIKYAEAFMLIREIF